MSTNQYANQVIVVGGGLAGLSAAHTILERGGRVLLLDKNSFCGGNSVKVNKGEKKKKKILKKKILLGNIWY